MKTVVIADEARNIASQVRVHQLRQQLRVDVVLDDSCWLLADVEIVYRRCAGGTIWPAVVYIGREARDEDVLADGGILGRCHRYNTALDNLRQLAVRLATAMSVHQLPLTEGLTIRYAHRELSRLDALIIQRQMQFMGNRTVRLHRLTRECAYFEGLHERLAAVVVAAEQGQIIGWDSVPTLGATFDA